MLSKSNTLHSFNFSGYCIAENFPVHELPFFDKERIDIAIENLMPVMVERQSTGPFCPS
ncbi:MAG: hypothetical protein ACXWT3_10365 [Methylococcaceae bacterium]